jgi:hypothetical protein
MALVIAEGIRHREFGGEIPPLDLDVLKRSARASLAIPIKGECLPKGTRLLKAYATSTKGPRRIVYLLNVSGGDLFLLFYRGKNDEIGKNITLANEVFRKRLGKHLDLLLSDIEAGRVQIIETE